MVYIPDVVFEFLFPADGVAAVDLRPSGDPGLTSCRLEWNCTGEYNRSVMALGRSGSYPLQTLISCGISSSEVLRTNFPTDVSRMVRK